MMAAGIAASANASAQSTSTRASGALGAGRLGEDATAVIDAGFDVAGEDFRVGVGARLRFVEGQGLRDNDWDEKSEYLSILRYAVYQYGANRDDRDFDLSLAAGELVGVTLGRGALMRQYASGLHVDHRRLGLELRTGTKAWRGDVVVDDVAAPRIVGARLLHRIDAIELGAQVASDLSLPDGDARHAVVMVATEQAIGGSTAGDTLEGSLYLSEAWQVGFGGGVHAGSRVGVIFPEEIKVGLFGEARLATSGYVPRWFGPLYEAERPGLYARARVGELGHAGYALGLEIDASGFGTLQATYDRRSEGDRQYVVALHVPFYETFQLGAWVGGQIGAARVVDYALASELRVNFLSHWFASAEVARLYGNGDGDMVVPLWSALTTVGMVWGGQ
jgi:hypothetical protein